MLLLLLLLLLLLVPWGSRVVLAGFYAANFIPSRNEKEPTHTHTHTKKQMPNAKGTPTAGRFVVVVVVVVVVGSTRYLGRKSVEGKGSSFLVSLFFFRFGGRERERERERDGCDERCFTTFETRQKRRRRTSSAFSETRQHSRLVFLRSSSSSSSFSSSFFFFLLFVFIGTSPSVGRAERNIFMIVPLVVGFFLSHKSDAGPINQSSKLGKPPKKTRYKMKKKTR